MEGRMSSYGTFENKNMLRQLVSARLPRDETGHDRFALARLRRLRNADGFNRYAYQQNLQ